MKFTGFITGAALIVLGILLLIFTGCGTTVQVERTIVHDTTYAVVPPPMDYSLPAYVLDSLVSAYAVKGKDTVIDVRYMPFEKRILVKARPDTLWITDHDTTQLTQYIDRPIETPFLSKLGLVFCGCVAGAVIAGLVILIKR